MNYNINNLINQQKLDEVNANEVKLVQERKEKAREKELEKKILESSPILINSPCPVDVYEEKGNTARKSLFFFSPPLANQTEKKFVYLTKKVFFTINPKLSNDFESASSYWEREEFRERTNQNKQVREKIENICVKGFAQVLEKKHLVKKLCEKIDSGNTKDFKELKIEDPQLFFENLFEYIDKLGDNTKDILIIASRKICRFIKKHDANKVLESSVSSILETDYLENDAKLIIVSQKGLLIPYSVECFNYNNTHYLRIHYEIELMDKNPIAVFKEETLNKSSD